jgi:cytoskeletal protein RodZ
VAQLFFTSALRQGELATCPSWLRNGRLERGMSIADVARTTKIQARILEDLEDAITEGLPADVFVRGFVRNYARCVGLSEAEALARYAACSRDAGPVASPAAAAVAELYAPATRRMSTVVPVAPGSPAAEVHAQGPHRYARAATAPSLLSSSPRLPRAVTERGAELAPELLEQQARDPREPSRSAVHTAVRRSAEMPAVVYPPPASSGLTPVVDPAVAVAPIAAPIPASIAAEVSRPLVAPSAPVTPMQAMPAVGSEAVAQSAAADGRQHEWPTMVGGQSRLAGKKRRNKKRKERQDREAQAQGARMPRAQTVRAPVESEIFESEHPEQVAVAGELLAGGVGSVAALSSGVHVSGSGSIQGSTIGEAPAAPPAEPASAATSSISSVASSSVASPCEPTIASAAASVREEGWPSTAVEASAARATESGELAEPSGEVWIPRMPPAPRPSRAFVAPTLTIDDADPESASQVQDDRVRDREGRDPTRRTFLPPILLESQDRANRQGGLTLAVILLLIAATLTLSYLMRRPSSGGGGMTQLEAPAALVG